MTRPHRLRAEAIIAAIDTAPAAERAALARDLAASLDDAALGELAGSDEGRAALRALSQELANAPGGIVDAPAQQQRIDAALQAAQDDGGLLDQVGGFVNGVWEVGSETVGGVVDLAGGIAATAYDALGGAVVDGGLGLYEMATGTQVDEAGWLPDFERGVGRLETAGQAVGALVENPGLLVEAVVDPIAEDWQAGRYGEAIGRGVAEGVSLVVGASGANTAARAADAVGDIGRVADDLGDVGRLTDDIADAGADVGRVVDDLPPAQRLPEFVDGARHVDPATGRTVIDARAGTTGDWNGAINRTLEPDVIYRTDTGYLYYTDAQGRVSRVEGELVSGTNARNGYQQSVAGGDDRLPTDQGGHLIASIFSGRANASISCRWTPTSIKACGVRWKRPGTLRSMPARRCRCGSNRYMLKTVPDRRALT